jgi:hypothetical protein
VPEQKKYLPITTPLDWLGCHVRQEAGLHLNDFLRLAVLQGPQPWELLPYLGDPRGVPASCAGRAPRYSFRLPEPAWAWVGWLAEVLSRDRGRAISCSQVVRALLLWAALGILERWPVPGEPPGSGRSGCKAESKGWTIGPASGLLDHAHPGAAQYPGCRPEQG